MSHVNEPQKPNSVSVGLAHKEIQPLIVILPKQLLIQFTLLHRVVSVKPLAGCDELYVLEYYPSKTCPLTDYMHPAFRKSVVADDKDEVAEGCSADSNASPSTPSTEENSAVSEDDSSESC